MSARAFHADGSAPRPGQVFVFGSNLSGIHGGGAARAAHQLYGAEWGVAEGRTGQSYAIPTVKEKIAGPLPLERIKEGVDRFLAHAAQHPGAEFLVTRVGCVLAGHSDAAIAPMFAAAPANCSLPATWREYLSEGKPADLINTIKARVLQLISEHANDTPVHEIQDDHGFEADLGMDSLDRAELRMGLEDEFGILIEEEEEDALLASAGTVAQLVNWVEAAVARKEAAHVAG